MDEAQRDVSESLDDVQATPLGPNTSRRRFVAGAVAAATGVVAAGYVKPTLRQFGVPTAMAALSPEATPTPTSPTFDNGNDNDGGNENEGGNENSSENDNSGGGENDNDGGGDGGNDNQTTFRRTGEGGVAGVVERPGVPTPTSGPIGGVAGVVDRPRAVSPAAAPGQIPLPAVLPQAGEQSVAAAVAGAAGVGLAGFGMLVRRRLQGDSPAADGEAEESGAAPEGSNPEA